jgi:acetaldehyde dehydrogenase
MHKVAIIGSGNIGIDLMIKVLRNSKSGALVGVDPSSEGLARAQRMGVPTTDQGVEGLLKMEDFGEIRVVFDATSAKAHLKNAASLEGCGKKLIDLTPAAIGPYVVPVVNLGHTRTLAT